MAEENSNGVSQVQKPNPAQEIDFILLLNIAIRTIPVIFFLIIAGFIFSWIYLRYTQVVYRSSCLLQIETITTTSFVGLKGTENNLSRELELIKSKYIIEEAVRRSNWDVSYFSVGKIQNTELYLSSPFKVKYLLYDNSIYEREFHVEFLD